jgi:tetratricopeptide (TPR) repeat protein
LKRSLGLLLLAALCAVSCARPPAPRLPEVDDYLYPYARPGEVRPAEAQQIEKSWRALLTGDVPAAEKGFRRVLEKHTGLVPAETGLAYVRLRAGRHAEAGSGFEAVLARRPDYAPALVGAGAAALRRRDPDAALGYYRRAQAAEPQSSAIRRRLGEVKLQITERRVAEAQAALAAGDEEGALEKYGLALEAAPELTDVRLALADLHVSREDPTTAAAVLEGDPTGERTVLMRLGEVLSGLQEYDRALEAYRKILSRDPGDAEALRRAREAQDALEMLRMPEEYRRIPGLPRISRADLAALVAVRVPALARVASREPKVAIDISGSWAREHIVAALALEIMDVYPNHTFQPGGTVRRGDLARAVARVLDLLRPLHPPAPAITDMARSNIYYDAAVRVVGAGLMGLTPEGAFEPWRPVSGREALDVVEALARLVGS